MKPEHSCSRDDLQKWFKGKRVALVGSGPGSQRNRPGDVDACEVVVRVNNYKCLSTSTGKRTDVFYSFFGQSILKRVSELKADGVQLCMAKCPNAQFMQSAWHEERGKTRGVDFRYIYEMRRDWWFCPTYVPTVDEFMAQFHLLGGHVPTTGFSALLDVLKCEPASVFMTGFDFFTSRVHNVNERWKRMNPDDPIGHVPDAERAWLKAHIDELPIIMDRRLRHTLEGTQE